MEISEQDLKHAQIIMTSMMKDIHEVCVRNNIKYWLDYGTLIGAVRHGGFIPWDDDFDICMLREDYDRFDKIAQQELRECYFWQTYKTDRKWAAFQGKVRLKKTTWMEKSFINSNLKENGFFVDIFPLDTTFANAFLRKMHFFFAKVFVAAALGQLHKRYTPKLFLLELMPTGFIMFWGNLFLTIGNRFKKSGFLSQMTSCDPKTNFVTKDVFNNLIPHSFGEYSFFIPEQYDKRLKALYGDYMTPPQLKDCQGHHNIVSIDFGKY